jgi:hypothetical protein
MRPQIFHKRFLLNARLLDAQLIIVLLYPVEEELLEPQLRPEFAAKIKNLEKKGKFSSYNRLSDLRREIENA